MPIVLDGSSLTIDRLVRVARHGEKSPWIRRRSIGSVSAVMLEEKLAARRSCTDEHGHGEFSEIVLSDEQVREFQRYLVYNHARHRGSGADRGSRGALTGRINVHARGTPGAGRRSRSRSSRCSTKRHAVVCQKGSVGASGDLAPWPRPRSCSWARRTFYRGERLPGARRWSARGFRCRGCRRATPGDDQRFQLLTAMSAIQLYDISRWLKQAGIAAPCRSRRSWRTSSLRHARPRAPRIPGAVQVARAIMLCVDGSDLATGKIKTKVQDAYSMRSSPQVIGAAVDAVEWRAGRSRSS